MEPLLIAANSIDRFVRSVGRLAGWMMMPLIAVIMFDVVTRKIDYTRLFFSEWSITLGYSVSTILQDLQWHFHGVILLMTFGFGYLANAHVRVDVFRELLPRRKQAWIEFIGLIVLALPFIALMFYNSWILTDLAFWQGEGSESLTGIGKRWIIKSFTVMGFALVLLAIFVTLVRVSAVLFGNKESVDIATQGLEIFTDEDHTLEEARAAAEKALETEGDGL